MDSRSRNIASQLALWADQLRDVSAMGARFAKSVYDEAHYKTVQDIAMAMMALATDTPLAEMEPLRDAIFAHPTPFVVGDGAVIDDEGRLLLIRRADNSLWAMPGGALEVGETPAEGVLREVLEETGVRAEAVALVGVFDSRLCGTVSRHHLYQFMFLCRPLNGHETTPPTHALEVLGSGWFAEDALPPEIDPGHVTRIPHAFRVWHGEAVAFFDRE
jgi:ADP-ribose pyrophosphatase YjhB (NUDIX family)